MGFLLAYLEGTFAFISPCFLPLLPVYIGYFAGLGNTNQDEAKGETTCENEAPCESETTCAHEAEAAAENDATDDAGTISANSDNDAKARQQRRRHTLLSALAFVGGFTLVFIILGIFAGSIGAALTRYTTIVNIVTGAVVIFFGISFLGLFHLPHFSLLSSNFSGRKDGLRAFLLGVVFSVGWTPCVGAHLAPALMLAATAQNWFLGALLLLAYSAGLGIPLIICAIAIDALKGAFAFIRKHQKTIQRASGVLLIVLGLLMMTGQLNTLFEARHFSQQNAPAGST